VNYMPVTQSRKMRKRTKQVGYSITVHNIVLVSITAFIVFFLTAFKVIFFTGPILLAVLTLLLSVSIMTTPIILLYRSLAACIRADKPLEQQDKFHEIPEKSFWKMLFPRIKAILNILAWGFLFYLLQPFITALFCWQCHLLMMEKISSTVIANELFTVIEYLVYLNGLALLVQIAWLEWRKSAFIQKNVMNKDLNKILLRGCGDIWNKHIQ
jgi:hypothetical protein